MNIIIKDEVLNNVLTYLATRPYNEVAGLIKAIHEHAKFQEIEHHEEKTISSDDKERPQS